MCSFDTTEQDVNEFAKCLLQVVESTDTRKKRLLDPTGF
jgi:hypothetical protein